MFSGNSEPVMVSPIRFRERQIGIPCTHPPRAIHPPTGTPLCVLARSSRPQGRDERAGSCYGQSISGCRKGTLCGAHRKKREREPHGTTPAPKARGSMDSHSLWFHETVDTSAGHMHAGDEITLCFQTITDQPIPLPTQQCPMALSAPPAMHGSGTTPPCRGCADCVETSLRMGMEPLPPALPWFHGAVVP